MGSRDPQGSLYYFKGSGIQRCENSPSKMLFFSLEATEIFFEIKYRSRWPHGLLALIIDILSHVKLRFPFIIIRKDEKMKSERCRKFSLLLVEINNPFEGWIYIDECRGSLDFLIALLCPTFS